MNPLKNLRDLTITTSSGTDVKDTSMLSGEAKGSTKSQNETNVTEQYSSGGAPPKSNLGGENSNS